MWEGLEEFLKHMWNEDGFFFPFSISYISNSVFYSLSLGDIITYKCY